MFLHCSCFPLDFLFSPLCCEILMISVTVSLDYRNNRVVSSEGKWWWLQYSLWVVVCLAMTHSRGSRCQWIPAHRSSWSSRQAGWCSGRGDRTRWMRCATPAFGCHWLPRQRCNCQSLWVWEIGVQTIRRKFGTVSKRLQLTNSKCYLDTGWSCSGPWALNRFCPRNRLGSCSRSLPSGCGTGPYCDMGWGCTGHSAPADGKQGGRGVFSPTSVLTKLFLQRAGSSPHLAGCTSEAPRAFTHKPV